MLADRMRMSISKGIYTGPGPQELSHGNMTNGYFGEVSHTDLINGDDLCDEISLTQGTNQESTCGWLKFARNDTILFVAKRTTRHSVSWNAINTAGAIFGETEITIDGNTYKVRSLTGEKDETPLTEWDMLIYGVHEDTSPDWASMTDADIRVGAGDGRGTWCQEADGSNRVYRGYGGVTDRAANIPTLTHSTLGFRPTLELMG